MTDAIEQGLAQASEPIYQAVTRDGAPLGGSDPERARETIVDAMTSLNDAMLAVTETSPNGRDYQPEALYRAHIAHRSRLARIASVIGEMDLLFEEWDR